MNTVAGDCCLCCVYWALLSIRVYSGEPYIVLHPENMDPPFANYPNAAFVRLILVSFGVGFNHLTHPLQEFGTREEWVTALLGTIGRLRLASYLLY